MEHGSAYYDITHGVGLAILTPRWMRYIQNEHTVEKFAEYTKMYGESQREKADLLKLQTQELMRQRNCKSANPVTLCSGITENILQKWQNMQ